MKDWNWSGILVSIFLIGIIFVLPAIMVSEGIKISKERRDTGLAKIEVFLDNVTLAEIYENNKETKYPGNRVMVLDGGETEKYSNVEIKGRGNATWTQVKKPLQLKFDQKIDLLGLGMRRKWILLANYIDPTNLRTDAAFYLERMVGEKYAYNGKFVELYIDGIYEGLYYLTRAIDIGKNSVQLKDPLGVLVELDNVYGKLEGKYYVSGNGEVFTAKDVVAEDNADEAMEDFLKDFNALEVAIKQRNYAEIERLIDVESFAEYYLISEFTANVDAYFTSVYFYKDGPGDKIHAGPAWDFDRSFTGGVVGAEDELTRKVDANEYFERDEQYWQWTKLYSRLIEFPEFEAEAEKIYNERMAAHENVFFQYVSDQARTIEQFAEKDGKKWNKVNFGQEVDAMLEWIGRRYEYLDRKYGDK